MPSLAIIGSGIAGLGCAWFLRRDFDVTVFEADEHIGGHANTVFVKEGEERLPVDTGFMVFNHVTYPNLVRLFRMLDVEMRPTDMSFSVRHDGRDIEYRGTSLDHLFAQRHNLLRPSFYRMLLQIDRFNREAIHALADPSIEHLTVGEYVAARGYGSDFLDLYLVPMSSAVWSTSPSRVLSFPVGTLLRFFHNHGFLGLHTQHPWWTVAGGSRTYVDKLIAPFRDRIHTRTPVHSVKRSVGGVTLFTDAGPATFDNVVFACHPPTTLRLLGEGATANEQQALSAFRYQPNGTTLHTDAAVMPRRQRAWSSWNYRVQSQQNSDGIEVPQASTHYWMNRLQRVSRRHDYFVSLNAEPLVDPSRVIHRIDYEHPLFDLRARDAQHELVGLNMIGLIHTRTFFAGAWQGYGFHEDGLVSALALSRQLLHRDPWTRPSPLHVHGVW